MSIINMRTVTPVNTFLGCGSSRLAGKLVSGMNLSKVLLVCDESVKAFGLVDGVLESLQEAKVSIVMYDGVQPDPPAAMIDEVAALCKKEGCQCVISVGGGSVLDTGKFAALLQANPGSICGYAANTAAPRVKGIPFIAVPTTAGTGSEVTSGAVVTLPNGVKVGVSGPELFATAALLDPALTLGLPKGGTASTAMDAFAHAVEAMLSGIGNPICDILSLQAVHLIAKSLKKAVDNGQDEHARQDLMLAAYLAGMSLNDGGCNYGHAIAHIIGAKYHLPHGAVCAVAAPMVIEYFAEAFPEKIRQIGQAMELSLESGLDPKACAKKVADAVRELNDSVGIRPLSALGVRYEDLPMLAEAILQEPCVMVLRMTLPEAQITAEDFLLPLQREFQRTSC